MKPEDAQRLREIARLCRDSAATVEQADSGQSPQAQLLRKAATEIERIAGPPRMPEQFGSGHAFYPARGDPMKPLSAIAAPILARLAERAADSCDAADIELRRIADRNRETIKRLSAVQDRLQPKNKEPA